MKTNQIITRPMGQFSVYQRTSDGMFNGSALMQEWNAVDGNAKKQMDKFLNSPKTKQFLKALAEKEMKKAQRPDRTKGENQEVSKTPQITKPNSKFDIGCKSDTCLYTIVKGRNTKNGHSPDTVWMHPYLFIKFAMFLNPAFEVEVISFVYDQLVEYRDKLGDQWAEYTSCCKQIGCNS